MENKNLIKNISLFMMLFLLIIGIFVLYWLYTIFNNQPSLNEDKSKATIIDYELYNKIGETTSYGVKVSPEEPGFGRINPFIPYKEPPAPPTDSTAAGATATAPASTP